MSRKHLCVQERRLNTEKVFFFVWKIFLHFALDHFFPSQFWRCVAPAAEEQQQFQKNLLESFMKIRKCNKNELNFKKWESTISFLCSRSILGMSYYCAKMKIFNSWTQNVFLFFFLSEVHFFSIFLNTEIFSFFW